MFPIQNQTATMNESHTSLAKSLITVMKIGANNDSQFHEIYSFFPKIPNDENDFNQLIFSLDITDINRLIKVIDKKPCNINFDESLVIFQIFLTIFSTDQIKIKLINIAQYLDILSSLIFNISSQLDQSLIITLYFYIINHIQSNLSFSDFIQYLPSFSSIISTFPPHFCKSSSIFFHNFLQNLSELKIPLSFDLCLHVFLKQLLNFIETSSFHTTDLPNYLSVFDPQKLSVDDFFSFALFYKAFSLDDIPIINEAIFNYIYKLLLNDSELMPIISNFKVSSSDQDRVSLTFVNDTQPPILFDTELKFQNETYPEINFEKCNLKNYFNSIKSKNHILIKTMNFIEEISSNREILSQFFLSLLTWKNSLNVVILCFSAFESDSFQTMISNVMSSDKQILSLLFSSSVFSPDCSLWNPLNLDYLYIRDVIFNVLSKAEPIEENYLNITCSLHGLLEKMINNPDSFVEIFCRIHNMSFFYHLPNLCEFWDMVSQELFILHNLHISSIKKSNHSQKICSLSKDQIQNLRSILYLYIFSLLKNDDLNQTLISSQNIVISIFYLLFEDNTVEYIKEIVFLIFKNIYIKKVQGFITILHKVLLLFEQHSQKSAVRRFLVDLSECKNISHIIFSKNPILLNDILNLSKHIHSKEDFVLYLDFLYKIHSNSTKEICIPFASLNSKYPSIMKLFVSYMDNEIYDILWHFISLSVSNSDKYIINDIGSFRFGFLISIEIANKNQNAYYLNMMLDTVILIAQKSLICSYQIYQSRILFELLDYIAHFKWVHFILSPVQVIVSTETSPQLLSSSNLFLKKTNVSSLPSDLVLEERLNRNKTHSFSFPNLVNLLSTQKPSEALNSSDEISQENGINKNEHIENSQNQDEKLFVNAALLEKILQLFSMVAVHISNRDLFYKFVSLFKPIQNQYLPPNLKTLFAYLPLMCSDCHHDICDFLLIENSFHYIEFDTSIFKYYYFPITFHVSFRCEPNGNEQFILSIIDKSNKFVRLSINPQKFYICFANSFSKPQYSACSLLKSQWISLSLTFLSFSHISISLKEDYSFEMAFQQECTIDKNSIAEIRITGEKMHCSNISIEGMNDFLLNDSSESKNNLRLSNATQELICVFSLKARKSFISDIDNYSEEGYLINQKMFETRLKNDNQSDNLLQKSQNSNSQFLEGSPLMYAHFCAPIFVFSKNFVQIALQTHFLDFVLSTLNMEKLFYQDSKMNEPCLFEWVMSVLIQLVQGSTDGERALQEVNCFSIIADYLVKQDPSTLTSKLWSLCHSLYNTLSSPEHQYSICEEIIFSTLIWGKASKQDRISIYESWYHITKNDKQFVQQFLKLPILYDQILKNLDDLQICNILTNIFRETHLEKDDLESIFGLCEAIYDYSADVCQEEVIIHILTSINVEKIVSEDKKLFLLHLPILFLHAKSVYLKEYLVKLLYMNSIDCLSFYCFCDEVQTDPLSTLAICCVCVETFVSSFQELLSNTEINHHDLENSKLFIPAVYSTLFINDPELLENFRSFLEIIFSNEENVKKILYDLDTASVFIFISFIANKGQEFIPFLTQLCLYSKITLPVIFGLSLQCFNLIEYTLKGSMYKITHSFLKLLFEDFQIVANRQPEFFEVVSDLWYMTMNYLFTYTRPETESIFDEKPSNDSSPFSIKSASKYIALFSKEKSPFISEKNAIKIVLNYSMRIVDHKWRDQPLMIVIFTFLAFLVLNQKLNLIDESSLWVLFYNSSIFGDLNSSFIKSIFGEILLIYPNLQSMFIEKSEIKTFQQFTYMNTSFEKLQSKSIASSNSIQFISKILLFSSKLHSKRHRFDNFIYPPHCFHELLDNVTRDHAKKRVHNHKVSKEFIAHLQNSKSSFFTFLLNDAQFRHGTNSEYKRRSYCDFRLRPILLTPIKMKENSSKQPVDFGKDIIWSASCIRRKVTGSTQGHFEIYQNDFVFTSLVGKSIVFKPSNVMYLFWRYNSHVANGVEFYLYDHRSLLFFFPSENSHKFSTKLFSERVLYRALFIQTKPPTEEVHIFTDKWLDHKISTFDYLLFLNFLSGRSFNDIGTYPIFPWILIDYGSSSLDLSLNDIYRDFSKPVGAFCQKNLEKRKDQLIKASQIMPEQPLFLYPSLYSNSFIVIYYLIRIEPFMRMHLLLNDNKFDHPDRQFQSLANSFLSCINGNVFREIIPEFFFQPEFLINLAKNEKISGDVELAQWSNSPADFIIQHTNALENDYVSQNINKWIDLIWGFKQNGPAAVAADNTFNPKLYFGTDDPSLLDLLGQIPMQLFTAPHPQRSLLQNQFQQISITHESVENENGLLTFPSSSFPYLRSIFPGQKDKLDWTTLYSDGTFRNKRGQIHLNKYPSCLVAYDDQGSACFISLNPLSIVTFRPDGMHSCLINEPVSCIAISGHYVLTGGNDCSLSLWDVQVTKQTKEYGSNTPILCCTISRNYGIAIRVNEDELSVLLMPDLSLVRQIKFQKSYPNIKPKRVLVCKGSGIIVLLVTQWNYETMKTNRCMNEEKPNEVSVLYFWTLNGIFIGEKVIQGRVADIDTGTDSSSLDYLFVLMQNGTLLKGSVFDLSKKFSHLFKLEYNGHSLSYYENGGVSSLIIYVTHGDVFVISDVI